MSKRHLLAFVTSVLFSTAVSGCSKMKDDSLRLLEEGEISYEYITESDNPHALMTLNGQPFSFNGDVFVEDTANKLESLVAGDFVSLYENVKTNERIIKCKPAIIAKGTIDPVPGTGKNVFHADVPFTFNGYRGDFPEHGIKEDMSIVKAPSSVDNIYYVSGVDSGLKDTFGDTVYEMKAMYEYNVSTTNREFVGIH